MDGGKTLGSEIKIEAARLIVIHDEWIGYNPHAPIASAYELRYAADGGFVGEGRLSSRLVGERVVDVAINAEASRRFLNVIAGTAITEGAYSPRRTATDNFPHIEIALHIHPGGRRGGVALLFTDSQGRTHAPWGACIGGRQWTIPGGEIGLALVALKGPLKQATLDRMMRKYDRQGTRAP